MARLYTVHGPERSLGIGLTISNKYEQYMQGLLYNIVI